MTRVAVLAIYFAVVLIIGLVAYLAVQAAVTGGIRLPKVEARNLGFGLAMAAVFLLAMDFWNWNSTGLLVFNIPLWVWYSISLSAVQTVLMVLLVRGRKQPGPPAKSVS